jgi:MFS transporter, FSR family, fosmidomycin resistance protein
MPLVESQIRPAGESVLPVQDQSSAKDHPFRTADVFTIGFSHAAHDTYLAFVSPLLPVLIENFALTKTAAGVLAIFTQFPSLVQPFFGMLADRVDLRYLVIFAPAVSGALMSLVGIAPSYAFIILFLFLAGLSNAGLHAVGPVMAGYLSGNKLGRGMSFWMVGGETGRVLGPIVIATAIGTLTFKGLPWLMIGGFLASLVLFIRLRDVPARAPVTAAPIPILTAIVKMKSILFPLVIILFVRAFINATLTTFLPIFLTEEGFNLKFAAASLSILEVAGVVGVFLSGTLSDRFGRRLILMISMITAPLFMVVFLMSSGWMILPILLGLGFTVISITPVIMAIVQETFPESRAMANGIYMAISFLIYSLCVLIVGRIGDLISLRFAMGISAGLVLLGIPFIFMLPNKQKA